MQRLVVLLALGTGLAAPHAAVPANFVRIQVTAPQEAIVRAIWRPLVGAVGGPGAQQDSIRSVLQGRSHPESRRLSDPDARDTVVVKTPASFEVDMNGGPIIVEVVGKDSVRVDAWQVPNPPPGVTAWGREFEIGSAGYGPVVKSTQ